RGLIRRENRGRWSVATKFPVNFPVSREFGVETGSQLTASSARECPSPWGASWSHKYSRHARELARASVVCWAQFFGFLTATGRTSGTNLWSPVFNIRIQRPETRFEFI